VNFAESGIRAINLHKAYKLNELFARNLASEILRIINREPLVDLELIFLDDKSMKKFNKRYRLEDRPTDVLSFRIDRREFGCKVPLGEIIISLDTARKNSKIFGTDFADEVALYIIHGILHLFGYDDESPDDARRMARRQSQILDKLCSFKNLSKVLTPR